ncbi:MAG: type IX secretion system outer membrane channel protein PorV [Bacteroidota bacterium]|nr:type IX secretion system outer membrane channel protein PorV [Bacteroidota bacterium]
MIRYLAFLIFLNVPVFSQSTILSGQDTSRRPIITAVPFLLISPDSRGSAMGETGVATSPDVNSVHWNNAKLAFIDKKYGFGMSYVPWLGKIVDDMSVSYLSGFYKLDQVQTVGLSMKYFDLGEIQLTDNQGLSLGVENPKELSTAFTYSRKLTNDLSIGGSARYIWSNLTGSISNYSDAKAGNSFSVDLGIYYNKEISLVNRTSELSFGSHISNIGGKITYGSSKSLDFIPVNLRVGTSLKTFLDQYNSITLAVDLNKLMVPSPPIYEVDINGNYVIDPTTNQAKILKGKNPNRSVLSGIFSSFSDAPDGFSEEIKEVTISTGLEYWYREIFSFRGGYFLENMDKGGRKFLTLGLGIKYNNLGIDFSYLSTPQNDHPLAETMRFSLSFLFDKVEDADSN